MTLKIVDRADPRDGLVPRAASWNRAASHPVERLLTAEELVEQYATARIALVPSFFEGFSFPAPEAMACGCL